MDVKSPAARPGGRVARARDLLQGLKARRKQKAFLEYPEGRQRAVKIVESRHLEAFLSLVIATNFVLIMVEADAGAKCATEDVICTPVWLIVCNAAMLTIYAIEAAMRVYAYRADYFMSGWNLLDFVIVVTGLIDAVMSAALSGSKIAGVQMLRIFRVGRLLRAAKLMRFFPELQDMLKGFVSAMSAMMWGFVMICLVLLMWSVLVVELLHPLNLDIFEQSECTEAFASVLSAALWFFQTLIAGDSWSKCSTPLINSHPASFIVFAGALITIELGCANLVLAVIVEKAQEAHEKDKCEEAHQLAKDREEAGKKLKEICEDIDGNADGKLSMSELMSAYTSHDELQMHFQTLDVDQGDLVLLFGIMDVDDSGDLTYEELVNHIVKSEQKALKRQMMLMRLQLEDLWVHLKKDMRSQLDSIIGHLTEKNVVSEEHSENFRGSARTAKISRESLDGAKLFSREPAESAKQIPAEPPVSASNEFHFGSDLGLELDRLRQHLDSELGKLHETALRRDRELQESLKKLEEAQIARPDFPSPPPGPPVKLQAEPEMDGPGPGTHREGHQLNSREGLLEPADFNVPTPVLPGAPPDTAELVFRR